jgi:Holliday junction DNA helicase RuvA
LRAPFFPKKRCLKQSINKKINIAVHSTVTHEGERFRFQLKINNYLCLRCIWNKSENNIEVMYEYIKGKLALLTPTYAVVEAGGAGYGITISLQTYSRLSELQGASETTKLFVHHITREDAEMLYGFFDEEERGIFRLLVNVNGVGPGTAMTMLSSLSADEVRAAILKEDINTLKGVKGIGLKTAQRIVVDLRDKVTNTGASAEAFSKAAAGSKKRDEALSALVALGFAKAPAEKTLDSLLKQTEEYTVEELIKAALKQM